MASRLIRINQWEILYPEFKADKFFSHEQCINPNSIFVVEISGIKFNL